MECTEQSWKSNPGREKDRRRVKTGAYEDGREADPFTAQRSRSTPSTAKRFRSTGFMLSTLTAA